MNAGVTIDQAREILLKYIKEENNVKHCRESEVIMRALARHLNEDEELWGIAGLLHDIDWELVADDEEQHGIKMQEILKDEGVSDELIQVIVSHVGGFTKHFPESNRQTKFEHALAAAETITGLIVATALVRPDKKLSSVEVKSVKKKFKDKSFSARVNRDVIRECEELEMSLEEFIELSLKALKEIADELGL
ncbi:hydrolase [Candidatus Falkowbacteria bacterium CG10_big_fil_rev_8_21_14_0_10_39_11]|uniref:Hydrolase n=1 Tax=Candidatus Falkowbacteria bacterium CG10_big_fil_rev_8_21_14_0_10_39_11 TaxID=1974565 RepID=A0A2H0V4M9_9BACT|nr:MAG: hydrolase [Candidatus Falkowbacteria bacterium CG10_big_fil_rev_8_21_14_0_10_39_11]